MSLLIQLIAFSLLAVGSMLAFGGVVEAWHATRLWRAVRMKAAELASTAASIVDIRGHVRPTKPLTAPLSGRVCAQFTVIVSRAPGKKTDEAPDVVVLVDATPFAVDDGTGRINVDLRQQRVPVTGAEIVKQKVERLTRPLEALMTARLGRPAGLWCAGRDVQATEVALVEGTEVSVVAKKTTDGYVPIHITPARPRVVAMQSWMRAALSTAVGVAMIVGWQWLR